MVVVYCYERKEFQTRKQAQSFYSEAVRYSDGAEQDRYFKVLDDLSDGYNICWDGITKMPSDVTQKYARQ